MDEGHTINQQLNILELENIQAKLTQIRESLNFFLQTVDPSYSPGFSAWGDVLSKFNLLVAKFVSYNNEISRNSLYKKMLLHPIQLGLNETEAHTLGYLLRTKQIPEIEKEEEALLEDVIPMIAEENESLKDADSRQLEQALARWQTRALRHDAIGDHAFETFERVRDSYDLKKRPTSKVQSTEEDNATSGSPNRSEAKGSAKSLDQILGWYCSGRRFDS